MRKTLLFFAMLFLCVPAIAQRGARGGGARGAGAPNEGRGGGGGGLKIERDLEYARPGPVVVWIHGGGAAASKIASPTGALISAGGVAVASIEYRTGPRVTVQMQLADAKAAVRWLRANAAKYNLDAAHIGAFGYDVGGQLAALLGTTSGVAALEGDEGNASESSQVQAVIDVAGPMTAGGLNPVDYVTKDDAPTLLIHGSADKDVSTRQSQSLVSALKVAGVDTLLDMQVAATHDLGHLLSPIAMQSTSTFVARNLLGADGVGDQTFWVSQSPLTMATKNVDKVRKQSLRVICGTADNLFAGAQKLHDVPEVRHDGVLRQSLQTEIDIASERALTQRSTYNALK